MIIDDDADIRAVTKEILRFKGYTVEEFGEPSEALKRIKKSAPDLIICDVTMPVLSGFEVRKILLEDDKLAQIPFVFVTARASRQHQRTGMNLGARDYLTKPFSVKELLDVVETSIARSEQIDTQLYEKATQLRKELLLIFPHEINTPLTQLRMCIYLMSSRYWEMSDEKRDNVMSTMIGASDRLEEMSSQFRDTLSLVLSEDPKTMGSSLITQEKYSLDEVLPQYLKGPHFSPYDQNRLEARFEPAFAVVGKPLLERCIFELVSNGLIHTSGRVVIDGQVEADSYELTIRDEGSGFKVTSMSSVDLFRQFIDSPKEKSGLGLGIATARRLAQGIGGDLHIESSSDNGTKCLITFPITQAEPLVQPSQSVNS